MSILISDTSIFKTFFLYFALQVPSKEVTPLWGPKSASQKRTHLLGGGLRPIPSLLTGLSADHSGRVRYLTCRWTKGS